MSNNTIPINLERERMLYLLDLFEKRQAFDTEKAKELKPLLENEYNRALQKGNTNLAKKIASVLITLNSIIAGEIDLRYFDRISIA
jgi:hypothetical protein